MAEPVLFEPALPEHAADIVAAIRSGFASDLIALTIYGAPGVTAYIRQLTAMPPSLADTAYTVVLQGTRTVGCAEVRRLPQALFLNYISFLPEFRSQGLGRSLLRAAIEQAGWDGRGEMFLDVLEHNEVARCWYERLGFRTLHSTDWWGIPLQPPMIAPQALLTGFPQAEACHAVFGFSQFKVTTVRGEYNVGRMANAWFRLTQPEGLEDADLWAALGQLDPARQVLAILREGQLPASLGSTARHYARLQRMSVSLEALHARLSS